MGLWSSNGRHTPSAKWKLLVASVLAAALIAVLCGRCESSMKATCMNLIGVIASSLSLTDRNKNVPDNNSEKGIMYRTITPSTITTSGISLKGYAVTSHKKSDTSTAENMGRKIFARTTTHVYSIVPSLTPSFTNTDLGSPHMKVILCKNYGPMVSAPSANSISRPPLTLLATYLKNSPGTRPRTHIYATTNTDVLIGFARHIPQCP